MSADGSLTFAEALDFGKGYPEFRIDQERDELGRFSGTGSKQHSILTKAFDPEQQRAPDGSWIGGADGELRPGSEAMDLLGHNLRQKQTPSFDDFIGKLPKEHKDYIDATGKRLASLANTSDVDEGKKGGYKTPEGDWTPERQALHTTALLTRLQDAMERAKPDDGEKPHAIILGGRPGSGKTTALEQSGLVPDKDKYLYVNADDLRGDNDKFRAGDAAHGLPGYEGWNSSLFHDEASELANKLKVAGQALGLNIIHDATLRSPEAAQELVNDFHDYGYDVSGLFVHTTPEVSARRVIDRAMKPNGRYVPTYILGTGVNERSFDAIKNKLSQWHLYDANGEEPKLVASGGTAVDKAGFNPEQERDDRGRWSYAGSEVIRLAKRPPKQALLAYKFYKQAVVHASLNRHLRGYPPTNTLKDSLKGLRISMKKFLNLMDEFASSSEVSRDMFVWRGISGQKQTERLSRLGIGDVIIDKAYGSTTKNPEWAALFARQTPQGAFLEIELPKGSRVGEGYRLEHDENGIEQEIVLPRGYRLEFLGRKTEILLDKPVYRFKLLSSVTKAGYRDDESRDDKGQWTREGDGFSRRNFLRAAVAVVLGLGIAHLPLGVLAIRNVMNGKPWYQDVAVPEAEVELPEIKALKAKGYRFEERPDGQYNVRPPLDKALTFDEVLNKGYPEYRWDQPRGKDGRWSGGSGSPRPEGGHRTADMVLIDKQGRVLLIRRRKNPFKGHYALPGGFVNPGESSLAAARRELQEETGIKVGRLRRVGVYSKPSRDPRGPTTSTAYVAVVDHVDAKAGDDASDVQWVKDWRGVKLAFDHEQILRDAERVHTRFRLGKAISFGAALDKYREDQPRVSKAFWEARTARRMSLDKSLEPTRSSKQILGKLINASQAGLKGDLSEHIDDICNSLYALQHKADAPDAGKGWHTALSHMADAFEHMVYGNVNKAGYNPQQARDNRGRWVAGGGSGAPQERSSHGLTAEAAKPLKEAAKAVASLQEGEKPAAVADKVVAATSAFKNIVKQPGWWESLDEETKTEIITLAANVVAIAAAALFIYYGVRPNLPHDIGGWLKFLLGWK